MYIDGIYLKRSWGASYENVAVMIAIGINQGGYREIIGCAEGFTESKESWCEFLVRLKSRRLKGVRMITGNKLLGMLSAIEETFPQARYQRCTVHFYRNVFGKVSEGKRANVAKMMGAIHAQESFEASMGKAREVAGALCEMKLAAAAKTVEDGVVETLSYTNFPMQH